MAYEQKPGQFTLFKNERKEKDTQPDYNGSGIDLNGTECWISAWVKKPEGKKPFFSISVQPKEPQAQQPAPKVETVKAEEVNDDLPF